MVRYERVILIRDRRTHHCDVGRLNPLAIICTNYFSQINTKTNHHVHKKRGVLSFVIQAYPSLITRVQHYEMVQ